MPAYAIQRVEPREDLFQAQPSRVIKELNAISEIDSTGRNKLQRFLLESGISSITEMDYLLREKYKEHLEHTQKVKQTARYLLVYDRVKQFSIREQMQTLAGRLQNQWRLENGILFIPYHPDQTVAKEFDSVWYQPNMVWDFTKPCTQAVKEQIFITLNAIIAQFKEPRKREQRLSGLQCLYEFCVEAGIQDIEKLDMAQVQAFEAYLDEHTTSKTRKVQLLPSLNVCRRTTFLQSEEIHWDANIWYLERMKLPQSRMNPSGSFNSVSFIEISIPENRKYAQEYMKYQIGITGQSISTIVIRFGGIKNFLIWLCQKNTNVCDCTEKLIETYLEEIQVQNIVAKTFNERLSGITQFFQFLKVRGYIEKMPFRIEYYQKKVLPKHHDRSVSPEVCGEILSKLYLLPEHLRCMYLHLWSVGLRISEVCTLKGNAYYQQGQDAWIQVYQVKMKNYKRIPISDGLYRIMQVYIRRNNIGPDDFLFRNRNGGAYRSGTFREQMKKFCRENDVEGGEYLFKSHDYRHTVATLFYDCGVSLQSVRDYLGHKYEEMTQQYVDYMPRKIAKASEEYFKNSGNSLAACLKKGGKNDG